MTLYAETEAAWLRSLPSNERARFLAWLSHSLTIAGRSLKQADGSSAHRLEQLYQLNEILHRISSYIGHALGAEEDADWLLVVTSTVLEPPDPGVKKETVYAWTSTRERFVSAT